MRTAGPRSLRAPLALWLAVLIACVQASSAAAWAPCTTEPFAARDDACCCAGEQDGGGCCDAMERAAPRPDRIVDACGCGHRHVPGATAQTGEPSVAPAEVVSPPEPSANEARALPSTPWRGSTRPAPDPPPPRTRA